MKKDMLTSTLLFEFVIIIALLDVKETVTNTGYKAKDVPITKDEQGNVHNLIIKHSVSLPKY